MYKFALVGLGFVSDRHIQAIKKTGNDLVAVCDIDPSKAYKAAGVRFFTDFDNMIKSPLFEEVDYLSVCTPNYLHLSQSKAALLKRKKVICEKPPIISREGYESLLSEGDDLSFVLQCRYAKDLIDLQKSLDKNTRHKVKMNVEVYRDNWYMESWKAIPEHSGGLLYNIGCHYFDILSWFFGDEEEVEVIKNTPRRCEGKIKMANADVEWSVAIDAPIDRQKRIFEIDGKNYNLTQMGFEGLHTKVYEEILAGNGFKIDAFDKTINLIEKLYGRDKRA